MMKIFLYIVIFTFVIFISYYLGNYLRILSIKVAKIDFNRKFRDTSPRWRSSNKPLVGGIVFFILFLLASIGFFIINAEFPEIPNWYSGNSLMLVVGGFLGFVGGLYDDVNYLSAIAKLFIQIFVGIVAVYADLKINLFPWDALNIFLTIFWVVGIMNSINMLDNMDGVAGALSLTIVLGALWMEILANEFHPLWFALWLIMTATLVGYLLLNKPPAKIYMGDSGSQFLGVLLAFIGLKYFWNFDVEPAWENWKLLFLAALPYIVLIADTTFVFFGRICRRQVPIVGGRDHISHMLVLEGITEKRIFLFLAFFNLLGVSLYLFLTEKVKDYDRGFLGLILFLLLLVILLFLYIRNYLRSEYSPTSRQVRGSVIVSKNSAKKSYKSIKS